MKKLLVLSLVLVLGLTLVFTACSSPVEDDERHLSIFAHVQVCESLELGSEFGPVPNMEFDATITDEEGLTMVPRSLITDNTTSDVEFSMAYLHYDGSNFTFFKPQQTSPLLLFNDPIYVQNISGNSLTLHLDATFAASEESSRLSALRLAIFAKDESFPDAYVLKGVLAPYEEAPVTYGIIEEGNTPASLANLPATTSLDLGILTSYQTREIVALLWLDGNEDTGLMESVTYTVSLSFHC